MHETPIRQCQGSSKRNCSELAKPPEPEGSSPGGFWISKRTQGKRQVWERIPNVPPDRVLAQTPAAGDFGDTTIAHSLWKWYAINNATAADAEVLLRKGDFALKFLAAELGLARTRWTFCPERWTERLLQGPTCEAILAVDLTTRSPTKTPSPVYAGEEREH